PAATSRRSLRACNASLPLQSSLMSKTYLKSDHFIGGGSLGQRIGAIDQIQRSKRVLVGLGDKFDALRIERGILQYAIDRHNTLSGRSMPQRMLAVLLSLSKRRSTAIELSGDICRPVRTFVCRPAYLRLSASIPSCQPAYLPG